MCDIYRKEEQKEEKWTNKKLILKPEDKIKEKEKIRKIAKKRRKRKKLM